MSGPAPAFPFDFFLSRRGSIAAVAQEVADILEAEASGRSSRTMISRTVAVSFSTSTRR